MDRVGESLTTREEFVRGARAGRGAKNPTRFTNSAWEWMLREGCNAYLGREHFQAQDESLMPTWCFERFGMSCTVLDDGRLVCIAGEHEDHYDPDFFIYNDVTVLGPRAGEDRIDPRTCRVEMFGYAESELPPTDFHTATRVDDKIYLIGGLGYPADRAPATTPVFVLDTGSWRVDKVRTRGSAPGWIHRHAATFDPGAHAITVGSGEVWTGNAHMPNTGTHRLHLADGRWEELPRATMRRRFSLSCMDGCREPDGAAVLALPGRSCRQLFTMRSNVADRYSAEIDGALVVGEDWREFAVDGLLDDATVAGLIEDLVANLRRLTGADWAAKPRAEHGR